MRQKDAERAEETAAAPRGREPAASRWGRAAVVVAALALALLLVLHFIADRGRHRRALVLLSTGSAAGLPPAVSERVTHEPDPLRAELLVARALVAVTLDPAERVRMATDDAVADLKARLARLELAAGLARAALVARPTNWQASMLLGAATYLGWSEARDRRLFTSSPAWDKPLTLALTLAPGKDEPSRFLVTAYLELWAVLSPEKRGIAHQLLEGAFRDQATFSRLVDHWLTVAGSREEAFAAIPPEPFAWRALEGIYGDRHDWEGYRLARGRYEDVLGESLAKRLDEADLRRRGGDLSGARTLYLDALDDAPPAEGHLSVLRAVLDEEPASPSSPGQAAPFRAWLDWALDLCLLGRCPLTPPRLDRLAGKAGDDLPDPVAAFAALAAGRPADAELLERRSTRLWHEDWGPYLIFKARTLTKAGRFTDAGAELAQVHRDWQRRPVYWLARRDLAAAAGDAAGLSDCRRRLAALARSEWAPQEWTWHGPLARLDLLAAGAAAGLAIDVVEAPAAGAVVAMRVDGADAGALVARPHTVLRLHRDLAAGAHTVELTSLAGGEVRPGAAILTGIVGAGGR
jgi:hypothetical protein